MPGGYASARLRWPIAKLTLRREGERRILRVVTITPHIWLSSDAPARKCSEIKCWACSPADPLRVISPIPCATGVEEDTHKKKRRKNTLAAQQLLDQMRKPGTRVLEWWAKEPLFFFFFWAGAHVHDPYIPVLISHTLNRHPYLETSSDDEPPVRMHRRELG